MDGDKKDTPVDNFFTQSLGRAQRQGEAAYDLKPLIGTVGAQPTSHFLAYGLGIKVAAGKQCVRISMDDTSDTVITDEARALARQIEERIEKDMADKVRNAVMDEIPPGAGKVRTLTSIVRQNLLSVPGYAPYCGNMDCGEMPRAIFRDGQFECPRCDWRSSFEPEFIEAYKTTWAKGQEKP